ncbi:MAG: iron-siderophore ABC transporter substrate-binding protein [Cyanobacteria bacterium P01_H01_bin.15]
MTIVVMVRFMVLAMLTGWAVAACQTTRDRSAVDSATPLSTATTDCRTIQHELGKTEICGQPQRVVVLGPHLLESLIALGIQPVAFADHIPFHKGDYDNPGQQIPYLGSRITQPLANVGAAFEPSIEAILRSQPDLILGPKGNVEQYATFSDIAPTLLLNWENPEQNLRVIAQAVNRSEQAEQLLAKTEQKIVAAREAFAPLVATRSKLLLLISLQFPTLYIGDQTGLCSSLTEELGFELVSSLQSQQAEPNTPQAPLSLETLPQLNEADSIILLGIKPDGLQQIDSIHAFEAHQLANIKQAWEANAIAQSLDASQAGRVYFIPYYMCAGLPGPIGTELYLEELKQQLLGPNKNQI